MVLDYSGVFLALLGMVGYGLSNALSKKPSKKLKPWKTTFYRNLFIVIFIGIYFLYSEEHFVFNKGVFISLFIGALGYIPVLSLFKALSKGKVGVVLPIANSSVLITFLLSVIFYHEAINVPEFIGFIMVLTGLIIFSINLKEFKKSEIFNLNSGIPYALITLLFWGILVFMYKYSINLIGAIQTILIIESIVFIESFLHNVFITDKLIISWRELVYFGVIGFLGALGGIAFVKALSFAPVTIVSPIVFSSPLIGGIYARVVFKERLSIKQITSFLLALIGIILLSAF